MWSALGGLTLPTLVAAFLDPEIDKETAFGHHAAQIVTKRVPAEGYIAPTSLGGAMQFSFEGSPNTKPEPINIIISANSSFGSITGLSDYGIFNTSRGFSQYLSALNFSDECLGLHLSTPAYANVSGATPELLDFLYRENFGDYQQGTCLETLNGGYHFRGWRQNQTGAFFLASSKELNLTLKHDLVPDGYNLGRQEFVRRASLGGTDYAGCRWPPAVAASVTDLVPADAGGPTGHYNHDIGIDGAVAYITVGRPICPGDPGFTNSTSIIYPNSTSGIGGPGSSTPVGLPAGATIKPATDSTGMSDKSGADNRAGLPIVLALLLTGLALFVTM